METVVYAVLLLLVAVTVVLVVLSVIRPPGRADGGEPEGGGGGGGSGVRPRPRPRGPRDRDDPPWWPGFERDFAAYVARDHESVT